MKTSIKFKNRFIDCKGSTNEHIHFVEAQAKIVESLLIDEINYLENLPDVFVITPFSEVSYKLKFYLFKNLFNSIKEYQEQNINLLQLAIKIFG